MTEWWLLIAAFWFWYFADCLKAGLKPRFFLSRAFGRRRASVWHLPGAVIPPLPTASFVRTEDPPIAFSPEGLTNVPAGSAGRPAPAPVIGQSWRWEDVRQLGQSRGRIFINGQDFCAVTPFTTLAGLRALIDGSRNRTSKERAVWLTGQLACWFRPAHLRRQQTVLLGRTATLVALTSSAFAVTLLLSVYLLVGSALPVSVELAARLGKLLPAFGLYLLGLHLAIVVMGWRIHRRLMPKRGEERLNMMLSATMLPPQALRLRSRIGAEFFKPAHPLAWLAVLAGQKDFAEYARQAVADLRWPLVPVRNVDPALSATISAWMSERIAGEVDRLLLERGVDRAELLKTPEPDSAGSCAYCPRCRSQFTSAVARCPYGIKLLPLK